MPGSGVWAHSLCLWLIVLLISPILLPVFFTLFLFRQGVVQLASVLRPDLQGPLEGLDVSFALDDFWRRPKGAISFIWILEGRTDPELILQRFDSAIRLNPSNCNYSKLTAVFPEFWMGYPFWRKSEVDFDMSNHFKVLHPPEGSDGPETKGLQSQEGLNKFLCSWMRSGFTKGLPLWQVMVVPDFQLATPGGNDRINHGGHKSVVALKIHHVIGDGYSLLRLLEKIVDPRDDFDPFTAPSVKSVRINMRSSFRIPDSVLNVLLGPLTMYKLLKDFGVHRDYFTDVKADSEVLMAWTNMRMERVKEVRAKLRREFGQNVPVIVVAASIFAGALRRFLEGDGKSCPRGVAQSTNFVMALPLGDEHPGDRHFCNHWTHGIFNVDMGEANAVIRLLKLHQNFQETVANRWPAVYHSSVPYQALLPKSVWTKITNFNMGASIGSTNIIGPGHKVFVGGREVLEKYAYVGLLWRHSSMTAAFFSYNGTISATLVANKNVVPTGQIAEEIMTGFFCKEMQELLEDSPNQSPQGS